MFLINLLPMMHSLSSWIPTFRRQSSNSVYGGWEDTYGGAQGALTERYDDYVQNGPYGQEYRMVRKVWWVYDGLYWCS